MLKFFLLLFLLPHLISAQTLCVQADCKQTITLPQDSIVLHNQITTDDSIMNVIWTGPTPFTAGINSITINNLLPGTYIYNILVTTTNLSQSVNDTVIVLPQTPMPPTGTASASSPITILGSDTLTVVATDPNGQGIIKYGWGKLGGSGTQTILNANKSSCVITGLQIGKYTFKCTFWNKANLVGSAAVVFNVTSSRTITNLTINYSDSTSETFPFPDRNVPIKGNIILFADSTQIIRP